RLPTRGTLRPSHLTSYNLPSFFFKGYGAHRDLHSFPTRRSSDLRPRSWRSWIGTSSARTRPSAPWRSRSATAGVARTCRTSYGTDRKSTRLNSSHVATSYAVFCLKKKIHPSLHLDRLASPGQRPP